jgi:hypothetical protein
LGRCRRGKILSGTQNAAFHTIYGSLDSAISAGGFHPPALETGCFRAVTMFFLLQPCHILLAILIGWANERQQRIIEVQSDQN